MKNSSTFPFCESVYPKIFHSNPTPQSLSNRLDGKLIDVNEAWESFTGYRKKEVLGRSVEELKLISFSDGDAMRAILTEKELFKYYEIDVKKKDGNTTHGLANFQFVIFAEHTYVVSTILDISELKNSQKQLFIANNFSDRLLESMHEALLVLDVDLTCIKINKAFSELTGFKEEDIIGTKAPFPHWPPEQYDAINTYVQDCLKGQFNRPQLTMRKSNGDRFEVSIASTKITNYNNDVIGYVSTAVDISERVSYQNELQENSKKSVEKKDAVLKLVDLIGKDFNEVLKKVTSISAKVMEVKRVSIWQFNADKSAIQCLNVYHLESDKFKNNPILYAEDYPNYFKALYKNTTIKVDDLANKNLTKEFIEAYLKPLGISSMLDVFINGADGFFGVICFEHIGNPRKWSAEEDEFATMIASIVSLAVENAERKKVETKLLLEKEFSDELLYSLQEGLSIVDLNGECIRVNKALCTMTGFTEEEIVGCKPPFKYWPTENYDEIHDCFTSMFKQKTTSKELTFVRKNGERFPVSLAISSVKDAKGRPMAYFSTVMDISERINEEALLNKHVEVSQKRKKVITELVSMIGQDYESTIKHIAKLSAEVLNVDRVAIWKFQNEDNQLVSKIFYDSKTEVFDEEDVVVNKTDFPEYFEAFEKKSIQNINNINNHPLTKEYAKAYNVPTPITSRLAAVIHGKNMRYGLINFESCGDQRVYSDEEESFAASVATIISLMIESSERIEAENQLIKTNEKLLSVNAELNIFKKELEQENSYLREEIDLVFNYEEMVYGSRAFSEVLTNVERVAETNATVLLLGESGTGKELIARAIHNISGRKNKPLIKVNCAAIPKELIESELFGHKKGSFTGAFKDKLGKFQLADGGTLFLDEIGELPIEMQPKLLRAIQESEIEQIGGTTTQKVDIRIIAATNRDLEKEIKAKNFREDLFFRINVFPITIPPLRERIEDIPILIEHFVNKYTKLYHKEIKFISEKTKSSLQSYSWPGNVRELENLVERAVILSNDEKLNIPNFKSSLKESLISDTILSLEDVQRIHIKKILKQTNWKIEGSDGAAELLQIKPSTLRDRIKKLGIEKL